IYSNRDLPSVSFSDEVFIAVVCISSLNYKTLSSKQRTFHVDAPSTFLEAAQPILASAHSASAAQSFLVDSCNIVEFCGSAKWFVRFFTNSYCSSSILTIHATSNCSLLSLSYLSLALGSSSSIDETQEEKYLLLGLNCMIDSPLGILQINSSSPSFFSFFSSLFTLLSSIPFSSSSS
ncbi:hypothetical protein PENTCL1PPCAC_7320, partial [Pristionchus entomophagus]